MLLKPFREREILTPLPQLTQQTALTDVVVQFILGLNFILLCFKLIIIHYHTQKQTKIKFKLRIKLNHNTDTRHIHQN